MIEFHNLDKSEPFQKFKEYYSRALSFEQKNIEASVISSFNKINNQSNSRIVNIKFLLKNKMIFFTNYDSPKAKEFKQNPNISALFFWQSINMQIRIKGTIQKSKEKFSDNYFAKRDAYKNALAISSRQSSVIESYTEVIENYNEALKTNRLDKRPMYWGGYSIEPTSFEFWEGHKNRLNKRERFTYKKGNWIKEILEP